MLGNIASIATLLLFVIYFIGRAITVIAVKNVVKEKFVLDVTQDELELYSVVDDVYDDNSSPEDKDFTGLILSVEGVRNIRIYSVREDSDGIMHLRGKEIYRRDFLNVGQALAIHKITGDLYPTLFIDYETINYMKVNIEWSDNLKNGVFSEQVYPKHTLKSILYLMCR